MTFPHGQTVQRRRRALTADPYNATHQVRGGAWGDPVALAGVFVAESSASFTSSATREQRTVLVSLFGPPDMDVIPGDQITAPGFDTPFYVHEIALAGKNPWSGWQPVKEIPLELTEG